MITTTKIETELGIMIAGAVDEGICLLEFSDRRMLNAEYRDILRLPLMKEVRTDILRLLKNS
jgi:AraC family transcriptional regulator of adaptative response/methylated-DNA-[protein]-cysteine methyltransferase